MRETLVLFLSSFSGVRSSFSGVRCNDKYTQETPGKLLYASTSIKLYQNETPHCGLYYGRFMF